MAVEVNTEMRTVRCEYSREMIEDLEHFGIENISEEIHNSILRELEAMGELEAMRDGSTN